MARKRISFRSDPWSRQHICIVIVIGDKKKMGTQEKFLKQCKKGCPSLNSRLNKALTNGLDRSFTKRMTASIQEREDKSYVTKTTSKTKKLSETKKNN